MTSSLHLPRLVEMIKMFTTKQCPVWIRIFNFIQSNRIKTKRNGLGQSINVYGIFLASFKIGTLSSSIHPLSCSYIASTVSFKYMFIFKKSSFICFAISPAKNHDHVDELKYFPSHFFTKIIRILPSSSY